MSGAAARRWIRIAMGRFKPNKKSAGPKKPPPTHFLCLPIITTESRAKLETSLNAFKENVTAFSAGHPETSPADGAEEVKISASIHPKAIRPVGALHLTLGVMSLDDTKLAAAVNFLKELDLESMLDGASPKSISGLQTETKASKEDVVGESSSAAEVPRRPLALDLKGLESMHPPQKTSMLYAAPTDPTGRLYPFCLALQKAFNEKEFLVSDDRKLKLHATIVNTIYAKGRREPAKPQINDQLSNIPTRTQDADAGHGHGPNANAPLKLDARSLIEKYVDYVWAENITLDRVAICEMGAKKILGADGNVIDEKYTEVASVQLPR
ncbi:hypothetical protein AC578_1306 [Pseudocercospora eumusae]|uniref:A-kinase anchor protein 7-like phosphoesterase domain-containing protein n=1 Tax=Pseudocercospora eumusae TaxID=321146 RepID=A0A139HUD9_9PEZI|nr:hypothetical protein AC578_1306 [Pseudocercospora eumusae]